MLDHFGTLLDFAPILLCTAGATCWTGALRGPKLRAAWYMVGALFWIAGWALYGALVMACRSG